MKRFVLAVVAGTLTGAALPQLADAREPPISGRPTHKANMLIVLDTSCSMTGVPGGQFQSGSECGVDCDNGVNCRLGGVQGICSTWSRGCQSDADCRHGTCARDGITLCTGDADCPQDPGTCASSGGSCWSNSDCPAQPARCTATGVPCDPEHACASVGHCTYGANVICANPDGNCPNVGTCSTQTTTLCQRDSECPRSASGGTCSRGGTPHGGCSVDSDCPSYMRCQASDDQCRADRDCPLFPRNLCHAGKNDGRPCRAGSDCPGGDCMPPPANPCTGTPNLCNMPAGTCNMHTENRCAAIGNPCSVPSNTCTMPPANTCQLPARATDTCVPTPQGTPGPIRMCAASQMVCSRNADCGDSDTCGPATSRAVIVKRAISRLVMNNYDAINFGLMTFWQDGYFPYYQVTGGAAIETLTAFEDESQLRRAGCFTWNDEDASGPSATCTISGHQMTLRATADSRYRVANNWHSCDQYDADFCGDACDVPNHLGRGVYQGSYYLYQRATQVLTSTLLVRDTYDGHDITVNGANYTYYRPLANYGTSGPAPPIDVANCGSICSPTCGGSWNPQMVPFLDTSGDPDRALAAARAITARMDYAANGGIITFSGTPTGCTLENDIAKTPQTSAYHYMKAVEHGYASPALNIPADPVVARRNFVLLVTDGAANGPGDVDEPGRTTCDTVSCAADNPITAGCACRSVIAAYHLKRDLGVTVLVVGFSGDVSDGPPARASNNLAKAGGSVSAFLATREDQLEEALRRAVHSAAQGN